MQLVLSYMLINIVYNDSLYAFLENKLVNMNWFNDEQRLAIPWLFISPNWLVYGLWSLFFTEVPISLLQSFISF